MYPTRIPDVVSLCRKYQCGTIPHEFPKSRYFVRSLRELLLQQQGFNKQLDLDKDDVLAVANDNTPQEEETFVEHLEASRRTGHGQVKNLEGVA